MCQCVGILLVVKPRSSLVYSSPQMCIAHYSSIPGNPRSSKITRSPQGEGMLKCIELEKAVSSTLLALFVFQSRIEFCYGEHMVHRFYYEGESLIPW